MISSSSALLQMGERASATLRNPEISNVKLLGWIGSKFDGVTRQHLVGAGAASVIILTGCVAAYMWEKRRGRDHQKREAKASRMTSGTSRRAQILGALRGGRLAVKRILAARHPAETIALTAEENLTRLLNKEELLNFIKLQSTVVKLEMIRKEEEGLELLRQAHKKAEETGHPQEAYELDMLIVEMLIYKGDYDEALKRKCLQAKEISDARRPLYKTIIQIILNQEEAKDSWREYQELRGRCRVQEQEPVPDASDHRLVLDFGKFKKTVKFLENEIKNARQEGSEHVPKMTK